MASPNLEKMKEQLAALKDNRSINSSGGPSVFWKLTPGDHDIRVLLYDDDQFSREFHWHYNVNGNRYLCAKKSYGKECPVCDLASEIWNQYVATEQAGNPDDSLKETAKELFSSKRYYLPVLVRDLEDEGPKLYSCGVRALEQILSIALDDESKDMFDPKKGFDLKVSYSLANPNDRRSASTTINRRVKTSPLFSEGPVNDETVEELRAEITGPEDVFELPDIEAIRADLDSVFGAASDDAGTAKYAAEENDVTAAFAKLQASD